MRQSASLCLLDVERYNFPNLAKMPSVKVKDSGHGDGGDIVTPHDAACKCTGLTDVLRVWQGASLSTMLRFSEGMHHISSNTVPSRSLAVTREGQSDGFIPEKRRIPVNIQGLGPWCHCR